MSTQNEPPVVAATGGSSLFTVEHPLYFLKNTIDNNFYQVYNAVHKTYKTY